MFLSFSLSAEYVDPLERVSKEDRNESCRGTSRYCCPSFGLAVGMVGLRSKMEVGSAGTGWWEETCLSFVTSSLERCEAIMEPWMV